MQCNVDTKNYRSNYWYLLHVGIETFMRIILTSAGRMHGGTLLLQEGVAALPPFLNWCFH